jgi:hypothetical protein
MSRREIVSAALLGLLLGAGWAAPAAPASSGPPPAQVTVSDGVKRFGPAWMTQRDGIYVLYLEGSEYDMAFQHATLLREEIQQGEMVYLGQYFRASGAETVTATDRVGAASKGLARFREQLAGDDHLRAKPEARSKVQL